MIPGDWLGLVFFVVLIAPGLLFDLLARRRRASLDESAFREVSRIVLASLAFSGFALFVLSVVRVARPGWLPDPSAAIMGGTGYFADHYELVAGALALQLALAIGAAYTVHLQLAKRDGDNIRAESAWKRAFRTDCPSGATPYARVRLANGTIYLGTVSDYVADLTSADREIILAPPLYSKTEDKPLAPVPSEYQRIVLRGEDIEIISVEYRRSADR